MQAAMPPKAALTGSFSVSDATNEVVCPLTNQDGSNCRKRCLGEKRYRSMQEHIRRAHPDYYIPKLPATEESFLLMINTPPSQRPPPPTTLPPRRSDASNEDVYGADISSPNTPRIFDAHVPTAAHAAVALTQLHEWNSDFDVYSEPDVKHEPSSLELPSLRDQFPSDTLSPFPSNRPRELLPSILAHSPPGRYASLPPIQRKDKLQRPRKPSMGQNARKGKHERTKSRDFSAKEFSRRMSIEGRKAMSAEPPTAAWVQGKRWEDLIEAATSATEADDDRDLTPMPQSPNFPPPAGASAAGANKRSSLPAGFRSFGHLQAPQGYSASPLQRALTPPAADDPEPFPSVESHSAQVYNMSAAGLPGSASTNDSSPVQHHARYLGHSQSSSLGSKSELLEIFCASCGRPWRLRDAFACSECICGLCSDCVGQIIGSRVEVQPGFPATGRGCPKCGAIDSKFRKIAIEFRV